MTKAEIDMIRATQAIKDYCNARGCRGCVFANGAGDCKLYGEPSGWTIPKAKTYTEDFFEKFPNATSFDSGRPQACRKELYGDYCCNDMSCEDCWNEIMPMEDKQ